MPSSSAYPSLDRKPGKSNWVDEAGGLPRYIERIAKHLHYEKGMTISRAIAVAVNTVKRWARGGAPRGGGVEAVGKNIASGGGGHVSPATQAKAAAALAEWEAKKAKAKASKAAKTVAEAVEQEPEELTEAEVLAVEEWLAGEEMALLRLEEREFTGKQRKDLAAKGAAMPGGRYPIANAGDLRNAIQAFGRGAPEDKDAIKRHIIRRARALGLTNLLPDSWNISEALAAEDEGVRLAEATIHVPGYFRHGLRGQRLNVKGYTRDRPADFIPGIGPITRTQPIPSHREPPKPPASPGTGVGYDTKKYPLGMPTFDTTDDLARGVLGKQKGTLFHHRGRSFEVSDTGDGDTWARVRDLDSGDEYELSSTGELRNLDRAGMALAKARSAQTGGVDVTWDVGPATVVRNKDGSHDVLDADGRAVATGLGEREATDQANEIARDAAARRSAHSRPFRR